MATPPIPTRLDSFTGLSAKSTAGTVGGFLVYGTTVHCLDLCSPLLCRPRHCIWHTSSNEKIKQIILDPPPLVVLQEESSPRVSSYTHHRSDGCGWGNRLHTLSEPTAIGPDEQTGAATHNGRALSRRTVRDTLAVYGLVKASHYSSSSLTSSRKGLLLSKNVSRIADLATAFADVS